MTEAVHHRLMILGSGPAGLTAAVYAARANLAPVVITGLETGGQLTTTTDVENWPGGPEGLQGPQLMVDMQQHAERFATEIIFDQITSVELGQRPFKLTGDEGRYSCDALIIATGAQAKWLNLPSEQKFRGFGVSACATCDGFFYKDKQVAVIGGGNTAVEEALFLTHFATKVTLIHRRDELRAEKILQNRLFANPKIEVIWDTVVEDYLGETGFPPATTGVRLRNVKTDEQAELKADGIFVAIGHAPAVEFLGDQLTMKPGGYVWTAPDSTSTSVPGVFAAGDVTDEIFRQAVTAAGMGCMAALEAERHLARVAETAEAAE